jgi:hypothetical protein
MSNQVSRDLARHLRQKIKAAIADYVILCEGADVPAKEYVTDSCLSLLYITCEHFNTLKIDLDTFGHYCLDCYTHVQSEALKHKAAKGGA